MLGYRERRAHKSQQKQEALGQNYSSERRVRIPRPSGMNSRENPADLELQESPRMENVAFSDNGLKVYRNPQKRATMQAAAIKSRSLITYDASGCASSEMWAIFYDEETGTVIYDADSMNAIGTALATDPISASGGTALLTATASITNDTTIDDYFNHIVFGKTVIAANGVNNLKWTRAGGWTQWDATASGDSIHNMWGLAKFKSRIYAFEKDSQRFWYGSADQVAGTLNPFDLSYLVGGNLKLIVNMTRDGGTGPDDYIAFITDEGETVVYAGNDPSDANNWSLVGNYKIGKPTGAWVGYGQQAVVLCEDDFYFLPADLQGKRQATPIAGYRQPTDYNLRVANGVFWKNRGLLVFSDGTALDVKRNMAATNLKLTNSDAWLARKNTGGNDRYPCVAVHKNKLFSLGARVGELPAGSQALYCIDDEESSEVSRVAHITFAPIPTSGRTNIMMVNPRFNTLGTATASTCATIVYRTAVVYDAPQDTFNEAKLSANAWITSTASANSNGLWVPGFGTGDKAQVILEVLSSDMASDYVFDGIEITVSDTGGI